MTKYPTIKWVKEQLKMNWTSRVKYKVLDAKIVGSVARGVAKPTSDLDIAVIIPPVRGKESIKVTRNYHDKFTANWQMPHWNGRIVDFQFFYPGEIELMEYRFIQLKK